MITQEELDILFKCLEWFLYGKISVLYALTCTLAKEVQLFSGLGIYSGLFAIYIQCALKEFRKITIIFYALCLLYILSTATIVSDLLVFIIEVSNNSICKNIIFLSVMQWRLSTLPIQLRIDLQSIIFWVSIVHTTLYGCCDFIAQCTLVRTGINHCTYLTFYSPKSSRSTVVGSCGVEISMS